MPALDIPQSPPAGPTGTAPFARFEWMMALRYLRARRSEGYISFIAIISFLSFALGVCALIVILSVMNGMRSDLQSRILGFKGHLDVTSADGKLSDYAELAGRLEKVAGVTLALPYLEGQALASSRYNAGGVFIRGMRQVDAMRLPGLAGGMVDGSLDRFDEDKAILIGSRLAAQLGLSLGDRLTLLAPNAGRQTPGTPPRATTFTIGGLYEIGHSDIDSEYALMPLGMAQQFLGHGNDVTGIEVYVRDPNRINDLLGAIRSAAGEPVKLRTWRERDRTLFGALVVERNVMFVILVLIVVIAAFNIIASLIMMVKEKSADIAILRTIGATPGAVARIFMITGSTIGVVGTLAGFLLGIGFAANIDKLHSLAEMVYDPALFPDWLAFLTRLPSRIDTSEVTVVIAVSLIASILATIYPAVRAARLDPVKALRYE